MLFMAHLTRGAMHGASCHAGVRAAVHFPSRLSLIALCCVRSLLRLPVGGLDAVLRHMRARHPKPHQDPALGRQLSRQRHQPDAGLQRCRMPHPYAPAVARVSSAVGFCIEL